LSRDRGERLSPRCASWRSRTSTPSRSRCSASASTSPTRSPPATDRPDYWTRGHSRTPWPHPYKTVRLVMAVLPTDTGGRWK
jgi:hypothetical protein